MGSSKMSMVIQGVFLLIVASASTTPTPGYKYLVIKLPANLLPAGDTTRKEYHSGDISRDHSGEDYANYLGFESQFVKSTCYVSGTRCCCKLPGDKLSRAICK